MPSSLFPAESELGGLLVGPESVSWRYTSDARLYLVMLYPLLLQVAHPTGRWDRGAASRVAQPAHRVRRGC